MAAILGPVLLVAPLAACTSEPDEPGTVVVRAEKPDFVHGTDHSGIDQLAATVVTDVQQYWAGAFPAHFDGPWHDLDGGFFSVDTTRPGDPPPPCSSSTSSIEGNAYYCATVDAIAWDRTALLPVLREHYGETAVALVLAHELGHAVQQRAGTDVGGPLDDPARVEAAADCYAGSYLRWVADGRSERLRTNQAQLDNALRGLLVFRDPLTTGETTDAHGTAFDRITAFQDGYQHGPATCSNVTPAAPRPADDGTDRDALDATRPLGEFFTDLVARRGGRWQPPGIDTSTEACAAHPVAYCPRTTTIAADRTELAELDHDIGDQVGPTLLASRYALAALHELGHPITGPAAGERATCLTGAYTGSLDQRSDLSAGDVDEAVETLLIGDRTSRDADGTSTLSGFDRVTAFRTGFDGGADACGV